MTKPIKQESPEEIELLSPYERSKIRAMRKDGLNRKVVRSESRDASPPLTSSQDSLNPEPLKSKLLSCCGNNNELGFSYSDIKLAVEWLKKKMCQNMFCKTSTEGEMDYTEVCLNCKLIDEAFSDVTNKEASQ